MSADAKMKSPLLRGKSGRFVARAATEDEKPPAGDASRKPLTPKTVKAATREQPVPPQRSRKRIAGAALVARVSAAIERELSLIESIVGGDTPARQRTEAERRARTLASLARTLSEVAKLRAGEETSKANDESAPADLAELRRQLARRLDILAAEAAELHPVGNDGP